MRTYIGTDITLDTVFRIPYRNVNCDTAFLICRRTGRSLSVFVFLNNRYRNSVTFLSVYRNLDVVYEINNIFSVSGCNLCKTLILSIFPACRNVNLNYSCCSGVDCIVVHLYDLVTLLAVGCLCSSLHQLDGSFLRNNSCQFEECRLKYGVDTSAKSDFLTNLDTVDGIELDIVFSNVSLNLSRQMSFKFFRTPGAVQKECSSRYQFLNHIVLAYIGRIVACYEVRLFD